MSDEITFERDGKTYRVRGVEAKAQSVFGASQEMDGMVSGRVSAAETALDRWRGPHSVTFVTEVNTVLGKMANQKLALWRAHRVLSSFPDAVEASPGEFRYVESTYDSARVDVVVEPGTAGAQTPKLRAYATTAAGQDERFPGLAGKVNLEGITAEVTYQRPLTHAEHQAALDQGENPASLNGATTAQTDPVDPATLIVLPKPADDVPALASASESLNGFTVAVALAFETGDQAMLDFLARDPNALNARLAWLREDPRRWNQLTPTEQRILIEAMPQQIGSMNGLPTVVRDQANRIVLSNQKAALQARLDEIDRYIREHPPQNTGKYPAVDPTVLAMIQEAKGIREKLGGIQALEDRLNSTQPGRPPAFLMGFSTDGNGRAIVAIGNPDHATNVATYVPGTTARLGNVGGDIERADRMAYDANSLDPANPTSVIMWLDYDAPQSIIFDAPRSGYAERAAPTLRDFQAGLDVSHVSGGAHKTVLGHSYGGTVIGHAASGGHLSADEVVFVAAPGANVDTASQLNIDAGGHVYATEAKNDPIRFTPDWVHGGRPVQYGFGATVFETAPGSGIAHAHSEYWDDGNPARDNMAAIITGHHDLVTPVHRPTPNPTPGPSPIPPPPTEPAPTGPVPTPQPTPGPSPTPPR